MAGAAFESEQSLGIHIEMEKRIQKKYEKVILNALLNVRFFDVQEVSEKKKEAPLGSSFCHRNDMK